MKWDQLVSELTKCAKLSLGQNLDGDQVDSRMLSVTLSSFMAIFGQPKISQLVSEKSLEDLIILSLNGLLGDTLQYNDQLKDLAQAFQHVLIRVLQSAHTSLLLAALCQVFVRTSPKESHVEQKLQVLLKMVDKIRHAETKLSSPYSRIDPEIVIPAMDKVYSSLLYKTYYNIIDKTFDPLLGDFITSRYEEIEDIIQKIPTNNLFYSKVISMYQPGDGEEYIDYEEDDDYINEYENEDDDNYQYGEYMEEEDPIIRLNEILDDINGEMSQVEVYYFINRKKN